MPTFRFVERKRELARLESFLDKMLSGEGQVVFIAGEPGSGKTALLREFAKCAQARHADLVYAVGGCNAQTGIGDPYLPFREVLALLAGDTEAKLAQGAITDENVGRLRSAVQVSGQALVEVGPILINTFVPGSLLVASAARFLARKAGWLSVLEKQTEKKTPEPVETNMDQSRLFEQYTNVLRSIATKHPLVVAVDDLQWADAGSINLLFHLGRRITASRLLLVGAYRPEEVALGRGNARHPLEKVLTEFKRTYGDITVALAETQRAEGRRFVDAVLDTESNCLGEEFRAALFHHTSGHALFTIELLRAMQDRGELERDYMGRWTVTPGLDWTQFPARVEGVIEERIGRLERSLRETLRVASVEGEDFTAQVIARVQEQRERQLLHDLSEELERRHRLVQEQGELRVNHEILSRYRFSHALFQRYLYNDLSAGERRILHREMARVLEELYQGCTEQVTVQLARHYAEAGDEEKAICYLLAAGDRARRLYANAEAEGHYRHAIALLPTPAHVMASLLYEGLGDVLARIGQFDEAHTAYQSVLSHLEPEEAFARARVERKNGNAWMPQREMERALQAYERAEAALGSRASAPDAAWQNEWLEIQLDRAWALYWANNPSAMSVLAERIRPTIERYGNPIQRGRFFQDLVLMAYRRDRYVISDQTLEEARQSLAALSESDNTGEIVFATFILGFSHLWHGDLDEAKVHLSEALAQAERIGDMERQVLCLTYLTITYRKRRQPVQVQQFSDKAYQAASSSEMLFYVGMAQANRAWLAWHAGDYRHAQEEAHAAFASWSRVSVPNQFKWTALFPLLAVSLAQADDKEAIECARALLPPPQLRLPPSLEDTFLSAIKCWEENEPESSRACLQQAVQQAEQLGYL